MKTDIADPDERAGGGRRHLERFGTVDILMNNAAIYGDYVGSDHSLEYLKKVFDVNLHGQWVMAKVVAPHLVQQRWGRIINVASIAAYLHQLERGGGSRQLRAEQLRVHAVEVGRARPHPAHGRPARASST